MPTGMKPQDPTHISRKIRELRGRLKRLQEVRLLAGLKGPQRRQALRLQQEIKNLKQALRTQRRRLPVPRRQTLSDPSEFNILINMLERVRKSLNSLVHLKAAGFPESLQGSFERNWNEVNVTFSSAIDRLEGNRSRLVPALRDAGFTGEMLKLKDVSLKYQRDHLDKAILTYNTKQTGFDRLLKWAKPGFAIMNSILGSLLKAVPGLEVAKEFKEHLEATYETVEFSQKE